MQRAIEERPLTLADMVLPDFVKSHIKIVVRGRARAILIIGQTGSGKTTLADIISKALSEKETRDIKRLNFITDNGIDISRKLVEEAYYLPIKSRRVYVLEEFHGATKQAQEAFLNLIDYPPHDKISFIFTTNQLNKLVKPLVDRCSNINLPSPDVKTLGVYLSDKGFNDKIAIVAAENAGNSFRAALQLAQDLSSGGTVEKEDIIDTSYSKKIEAWSKLVLVRDFENIAYFSKLNDNYFMAIKNIAQITNDYLAFKAGNLNNSYLESQFVKADKPSLNIFVVLKLAKNAVLAYDQAREHGEVFAARYYAIFAKE